VAQLVAALIMVHGLLSFLSDVYGLFDPSGKTLWLFIDHRQLRPVDDMVLLSCMVGESRFVMSWSRSPFTPSVHETDWAYSTAPAAHTGQSSYGTLNMYTTWFRNTNEFRGKEAEDDRQCKGWADVIGSDRNSQLSETIQATRDQKSWRTLLH